MSSVASVGSGTAVANDPLTPLIIEAFEKLDKWKGCLLDAAPSRMVFEHNRKRAAGNGFPSSIEIGKRFGLTDHEISALFGWTTGDYRFLNPIARGGDTVDFEDYPFLPTKLVKATCRLHRDDVMPYVHVLNSALLKLPPLVNSKLLWRGHRRRLSQKSIGSRVVMKGFTSVSRDRDNALAFCVKANEGRSNQRTLLAFLENHSSRCIAKFSARKDEMEVMFPLNTTFEVVAEPEDSSKEDKKAVDEAVERLRNDLPDAEIDLVYLKEVQT